MDYVIHGDLKKNFDFSYSDYNFSKRIIFEFFLFVLPYLTKYMSSLVCVYQMSSIMMNITSEPKLKHK